MTETFHFLPTIDLLILTIFIIALAGILRGFMGFGPALITIPVLAYIFSPKEALVIHIIMEIPSTIFLLPFALRHSNLKEMIPMFSSMTIAIPLGMLMIVLIDPQYMRMVISILVLILVGFLWTGWKVKSKIGLRTMILSGACGGFIQGSAGMGGPPIVSILLARGDPPDNSRGNEMFLMAGIVVITILTQLGYGLINLKLFTIGMVVSPVYMITTFLGSRYYSNSGKNKFKKFALILLAIIASATLIASFY